ncbi:MAG: DsrE/DsrF/DrsH-like family protein [Candidatus Marsarchaeota archaeon]|nr:DsrE/DsrF/DrsH-like family protein [Candidatus Marsarchaeota archaeon]
MSENYTIMVVSGELHRLYMSYITAIGLTATGSGVYMFFTMEGLKGVTKDSEELVLPGQKPLGYYVSKLLEMEDVELAACSFGMNVMGIPKERLLAAVKVSGVTEFALKSNQAKGTMVF